MKFQHVCEVCGLTQALDADTAAQAGWDYPPHIGRFGVIGPRTCPDCPMTATLWWALTMDQVPVRELPARHARTMERIKDEPRHYLG